MRWRVSSGTAMTTLSFSTYETSACETPAPRARALRATVGHVAQPLDRVEDALARVFGHGHDHFVVQHVRDERLRDARDPSSGFARDGRARSPTARSRRGCAGACLRARP